MLAGVRAPQHYRVLTLLCVFLGILVSLSTGRAAAAADAGAARHAWSRDFPDPDITWTGQAYVAMSTASHGVNLPMLTSPDLVHWKVAGDALPRLPAWSRTGHSWTPALWKRGNTWVLYYATRDAHTGQQCLSVATSPHPTGPYVDRTPRPWLCQHQFGGSIDPSPYLTADGTPYLIWKSDDNARGHPSTLWSQRLSPDGLCHLGEPVAMLHQSGRWQAPTLEAPSMVPLPRGGFLLLYSAGNTASESYAIGYARCQGPTGPCRDLTGHRPWLASHAGLAGPGGQSPFLDAHGPRHLAIHAWTPGRTGYPRGARSLWILGFDPNALT